MSDKASMQNVEVGRILSVRSSRALVQVSPRIIREGKLRLVELGTVLKIVTSNSIVVAMCSSLKVGDQDGEGMSDGCIAHLDILGEISTNATTRETKFYRGVRCYPVISEPVMTVSAQELDLIFSTGDNAAITVGKLQQDGSITAQVRTDELLSKHFAILGSTGSGKSCTVALVLREILKTNPDGHVVLFDPHNEYSKSFGHMAESIRHDTLDLPLWLFDFEEMTGLLCSDIEDHARAEREIYAEVILKAKLMYAKAIASGDATKTVAAEDIDADLSRGAAHITLDSPDPYRIRDVIRLVKQSMGKLENASNIGAYKRILRRIDTLMSDPRYAFVFRNQSAPRPISEIVGRIFRLPVAGKPICILDFSSLPSETLNIVVSVVSRLAFEVAMWSDRKVPILLVCEEAHRYIPGDPKLGFASTRRAIGRIAKEGRKYGVSLAIISQRPSELEETMLSQCSTIFSMRLSNEQDQLFVKAAVPDGAEELLNFLPSLGTAESMIFGEAVSMPMRVLLSMLEPEYRPHSSSAKFTDVWAEGDKSQRFIAQIFENWRHRRVGAPEPELQPVPPPLGNPTSALRKAYADARPADMGAAAATAAAALNSPLRRQNTAAPALGEVNRFLSAAYQKTARR